MSRHAVIASIDVGIFNLALVLYDVPNRQCSWYHCDITTPCPPDCPLLHHTKSLVDRMRHWEYRYGEHVDAADVLLVEQQPHQGLTAVEMFLADRWRSKLVVISPRSMHKHFGIGNLTYEGRKLASVRIAVHELEALGHPEPLSKLQRKHDVADAILQLIYYLARDS